jgi:hypothetical protein
VRVPEDISEELLASGDALGGRESWGLAQTHYRIRDNTSGTLTSRRDVSMEPFSYSTHLVELAFSTIDALAEATDVERCFRGRPPRDVMVAPPEDWQERIRRFNLLAA